MPTGTRWFNLSFITKLPLPPLHGAPTGNLKVGPVTLSFFFFSLLFSSCFFSLSQIFLASLIAFLTAVLCFAMADSALVSLDFMAFAGGTSTFVVSSTSRG